MTYFMKSGNNFFSTAEANIDIRKELPNGTYIISFDKMRGFYFEMTPSFDRMPKAYGDVSKRVERIVTTFKERPNSTGVILAGEKGSGKTMLAKLLSIRLFKDNVITVIVNQPYKGDEFNKLIMSIEQPALVIFDEFEKLYSREDQQELLTLFDGVFSSKKLFAITCNDKFGLSDYMVNRPGRFYYAFHYKGLDEDFIREYLGDTLENKAEIEPFIRLASTFDAFNFDMLKALVEEMNRFGESVSEAIKYVNVQQSYSSRSKYNVISLNFKKDKPKGYVEHHKAAHGGNAINPYTGAFYVYYDYERKDEDDEEPYKDSEHIPFEPLNIKHIGKSGAITLENDIATVVISKVVDEKFDVSNHLYTADIM